MKKFITFILFMSFQFILAQYKVTGTFTDNTNNIHNVALYKIVNGQTNYIKYANVKNKGFTFEMDSLPAGNYRALYHNVKTGYVDFIYNKEDVKFTVNSQKGQPSVTFLTSKENQLLLAYNYNISQLQYKLDSVQLAYFKKPTTSVVKYKEIKSKIDGAQKYYEDLAKNNYCLSIIKATKRYNAPLPYTLPEEYLKSIIQHFFDYIDFDNQALRNSMFVKNRLNDYVFYLHQTDDVVQQNQMYIQAIKNILLKTNDDVFKEDVLRYFLENFTALANSKVVSALLNMYQSLPVTAQHPKLIEGIKNTARTLIGMVAPNIKISDTETLYSLNETEKYLIIFWSSSCSHCTSELPKVKEILSNNKDFTVIAVGLEDQESKQSWNQMVNENFSNWKNVIALNKWTSEEAVLYNVNSTPSYFILNNKKRIVAKPNNFEVLQEVLKK